MICLSFAGRSYELTLICWMSFLGRSGKECPIDTSEGSVSVTGPVLRDDV